MIQHRSPGQRFDLPILLRMRISVESHRDAADPVFKAVVQ